MKVQYLKLKCIEASKFYYDYLEKNNNGIEKINISSKNLINGENDTWELHIGKKLFSPDDMKIHNRQYDEDYGLEDFAIKEYDADNKILIIKFKTHRHFGDTPAHNLEIISDLKFLIKNIEKWFTDNGQKIFFNEETNSTQNGQAKIGEKSQGHRKQDDNLENVIKCDLYPNNLNDNQIQAFKNILSNRYNYIWGPPGTGKTCYVLSSAVLHYLNSDNPKIGIFAPTNNALEHVLSSIIKHLDELGIPREILLRIGAPTRDYAKKYPETCEDLGNQLKEVEGQIDIIEKVIEYRRGKYVFNSVFAIQKDIQNITNLNKQLGTLLVSKSQKEKELEIIIKESKSLISRLKHALNVDSRDYQNIIAQKENELSKIREHIEQMSSEITQCFMRITNVDTRSEKIRQIIQIINIRNYTEISEQLNQASKEIEDYLIVNNALSENYPNHDDAGLKDLLKQHEENLKAMQVEKRINKCLIIGMTLDSYIGRFSDVQINFSSIFLDEAGYVPLIKALTLFSNGCNITFLGDHKQLPPVCEFDNYNNIPGFCRLLWSKPSIFSETILHHDEEYCLNIAEDTDCPEFAYTKKSILTESHRFGANLSRLLNRLIYHIGYKSADEHDVELYFVDAPSPNVRNGRRNENECRIIYNILNGFLDDDYCILTPYLKQVALLKTRIKNASREERITNIHKSQGREWDTVILSVVDGSNIRPWFTDSNSPISQGLYVLNTAISRARKKLIIVCDAKYWLLRQDAKIQLISNLINISKQQPAYQG